MVPVMMRNQHSKSVSKFTANHPDGLVFEAIPDRCLSAETGISYWEKKDRYDFYYLARQKKVRGVCFVLLALSSDDRSLGKNLSKKYFKACRRFPDLLHKLSAWFSLLVWMPVLWLLSKMTTTSPQLCPTNLFPAKLLRHTMRKFFNPSYLPLKESLWLPKLLNSSTKLSYLNSVPLTT